MTGDYIQHEIINEIVSQFEQSILEIFNNNLSFCFIFGGFGKGYATTNHDIDMFIGLSDMPSALQENEFREWYYSIHYKFGLSPDFQYPGELVQVSLLREKIRYLEERSIRPIIERYYEYEAILWTDAIAGDKIGLMVFDDYYPELYKRCFELEKRWRNEVAQSLKDLSRIEQDSLDLRRLFKKYGIKYLKQKD